MSTVDQQRYWKDIAATVFRSRFLDQIEEEELLPSGKIFYQFTARGHDLAQVILGSQLTHKHDAATGYYRSRPLLLACGLELEDAAAGPLGRSGGFSDGRDIGVVCNLPSPTGVKILPMGGGVGSQYTPTLGWAQGLRYRAEHLGEEECTGAVAVALGGDGSVATNGFWAALNAATTQRLPMLFFIEDNAVGLSVPSSYQTPGGDIAQNLRAFQNLCILSGDGSEPTECFALIREALEVLRGWQEPVLLRLRIPRLSGHSGQDNQAYRSKEELAAEKDRDPLPKLLRHLESLGVVSSEISSLQADAERVVRQAVDSALARAEPESSELGRHLFFSGENSVHGDQGALSDTPSQYQPEGPRINVLTAIRKTLETELAKNSRLLLFGEDVARKGGVHGATLGLFERFGEAQVFDTSLSEEAIVGRAIGLCYAGLKPVAEIQFRKYADPAMEQLNDCGTTRWRTINRFSAPIVVRMPGGFARCGDPWHSMSNEVMFTHAFGWRVAFPSNAEDAVGLLRYAMRSRDPVLFFEHRHLLDSSWARRAYPGDDFTLPFGKARVLQSGGEVTVISWGAILEHCEKAISNLPVELIDLRTLCPWDEETVYESVVKTGRLLVVHEDNLTAGFGAEIVSKVTSECFAFLKAPPERLAVQDIPLPYNPRLLEAALPSVEDIRHTIFQLLEF